MPRERDRFREYVEYVENNKWKCKFCGNKYRGSAPRIRAHLAGIPGHGIEACDKVDHRVKEEASQKIKGEGSMLDRSTGGTSREGMEGIVFGASQIVYQSDEASNPNDTQNSNQPGFAPPQPSCYWPTETACPQYQVSLSTGAMPPNNIDTSPPQDLSDHWLHATHGSDIASSPQQLLMDSLVPVNFSKLSASSQGKGLFKVIDTKGRQMLEGKMGEAFQRNTTKILEYLLGYQLSRLGIYGMGGVGKTTIMVHIHNRLLKETNYDNILWITVSQDFRIQGLQDEFWKVLGLGMLQEKDVTKRAAMLCDSLTKRGKSIVILDDVWDYFDLKEVGIPNGIKLVLTTRSIEVCHKMGCQEMIKIEPLSHTEAESLFLEELGSEVALDLETEVVAKSIVKECGGLPLAIITMARSMQGVTHVFEWEDCLEKLRQSEMGKMVMENKVIMKLKSSYNHLGNAQVQQCFLSCALFPKDKLIDKFELIEFFIDQGLIGQLSTREKQYNRGFTILNRLENVCLLEDHGEMVKMHNLIRDMALHIMRATSIVEAGKGLRTMPYEEYWTDALEKVSLMRNEIGEFPLNMSPNCPKLSIFLMNSSLQYNVVIPNSFFKKLLGLQVLNLSRCKIRELPDSISDLVNLRALLLRECRELCHIPYLGKLGSLRKLDIFYCHKVEALEGLEMLVNLRYLDLSHTGIKRLPKGTLEALLNLQYFKIKAVNGEDITKLRALETVACCFEDVDDFNKFVRMPFEKRNNLRHYELCMGQKEGEYYEEFSDDVPFLNWNRIVHVNTRSHAIVSAGGESSGGGTCILIPQDVRKLIANNCDGTTNLSDMGPLKNLEELEINEWRNLRVLCGGQDEEIIGNHGSPAPLLFPSLRVLRLRQSPKLKYLFGHGPKFSLPHLQEISIGKCEEMVGITVAVMSPPPHLASAFPSLENIDVWECHKLKRVLEFEWLPHFPNLRRIRVLRCEIMEEIIGGPPPYMLIEDIPLEFLEVIECNNIIKLLPYELLIHLQNIQAVFVDCCKEMVEIVSRARQGQEGSIISPLNNPPSSFPSSIFLPKLNSLSLRNLPQLKSICNVPITCDSMEILEVIECPELNTIPLQLRLCDIEDLPRIEVEGEEKWKMLTWDRPDAQAILQSHLQFRGSRCILEGRRHYSKGIRAEALQKFNGKGTVLDISTGGTSGDGKEIIVSAASQIVFQSDVVSNPHDTQNSNQPEGAPQQPSCYWSTGTGTASACPQCQVSLPSGQSNIDKIRTKMANMEEKKQVATIGKYVGTDDKVDHIMGLMNIDAKDERIVVVIHGKAGIGKTTLAKLIYNQVSWDFDGSSFLTDITETDRELGGFQLLQTKLISDVLKRELEDITFFSRGIDFFRDSFCNMRVLIVLDDVENASHVKKLIGDGLDCFASGSRILVTTRNNAVLEESPQICAYHVSRLDKDQALQLLRQHSSIPTSVEILNSAPNAMAGLPLFIEVMGAVLNGTPQERWSQLPMEPMFRQQNFRPFLEKVYQILDDKQKQIFLDIACFITGIYNQIAWYLWYDTSFLPSSEILTPLAKIGENDQIWMHSLLRQFGREIVSMENLTDPGRQSRLFNHEIALDTIKRKKGTEMVEALCLNFHGHTSDKLTPEDFESMPNLRFLQLDHADIAGDFANLFPNLRWLRWRGCPRHPQIVNFQLGNLTILDLSCGKVTKDWEGWDQIEMKNLRVLDLTGCADLLVTPKFTGYENLTILILERCSQLVKIDHSIGHLQHLVTLNLKFCTELSMLPVEVGQLTALQELLMDGTLIQEIPISIGHLKQLETLTTSNCFSLSQLPRTICHLTNVSLLSLDGTRITALPDFIGELIKLKHLSLRDCRRLRKLPNSVGNIGRSLVELDVSGTGVSKFPDSLKNLQGLKVLRMNSCFFRDFPPNIGELTSLEEIQASWCRSLEGGIPSKIQKLHNLRILRLRHSSISSIPMEIDLLSNLHTLDLLHCDMIKKLPKLPSSIKVFYADDELKSSHLP